MKLNTKRRIFLILFRVVLAGYFVTVLCRNSDLQPTLALVFLLALIALLIFARVWYRCPHCNKPLRSFRDVNFCEHCGHSLDELYDNTDN